MSTDWYFRVRAPLRQELAGLDLDALVARAPGRLREIDFPHYPRIGDFDAHGPRFGPGTTHVGHRFRGFAGAATMDGELFLAIWTQNLERVAESDDPDVVADPSARGLDILVDFVAWATTGPAGEVVGCIASEHDDFGHAHPLVRDSLGRILFVETEETDPSDGMRGASGPDVPIPDVIPVDLIRRTGRSRGALDCAALRDRFRPYDADVTDVRLGAGPRRPPSMVRGPDVADIA